MEFFLDIFVFMNTTTKVKLFLLLVSLFANLIVFSQKKCHNQTFDSEIKKKANEFKSNLNFNKSAFFFLEEEWDSTLVYTMKFIREPDEDISLESYSHYFRGYSFKEKKLFDQALQELNLISTQFRFHYLVKNILGEVSLELNQYKKAITYFQEVEALDESQYAYIKKSKITHHIGLCYLHLRQFEKAEPYLIKNVELKESQNDSIKLVGAYGNIATLYYEQYKDDLAIPYFEKAYQLSQKVKDYKSKQNTALNMAVVEENRKNFKKALVYRKEYEQWKDSVNDQNKIWEVAKLEKEFAVKEKQKEVGLLQVENKAKVAERNGLLYSVLTLLILLGITFYFYKENKKTNKIIVEQKEGLDALNASKDKLFSIVSHDLRSSVNALKASNTRLLENLEEKNLEALDDLLQNNSAIVNGAYNLLDNLLNWALLQTKQSYFEITSLRLYYIVEQMGHNYKPLMLDKSIGFENNILKKDIVFADQESLKIILRNLLDNAIKFSNPNGIIKVYTDQIDEYYCNLIIEDSGIGINEEMQSNLLKETVLLTKKKNEDIVGTGLGLQLCKALIKKNKGLFSIKSELGKGTKMIVSLPKNKT